MAGKTTGFNLGESGSFGSRSESRPESEVVTCIHGPTRSFVLLRPSSDRRGLAGELRSQVNLDG
jgi:hypothetical protein